MVSIPIMTGKLYYLPSQNCQNNFDCTISLILLTEYCIISNFNVSCQFQSHHVTSTWSHVAWSHLFIYLFGNVSYEWDVLWTKCLIWCCNTHIIDIHSVVYLHNASICRNIRLFFEIGSPVVASVEIISTTLWMIVGLITVRIDPN